MTNNILQVSDLVVSIEDKAILNGLDISLQKGYVHALMGKNGSGKSTLAQVLMGNPIYYIEKGKIFFSGQEINAVKTEDRAKLGLFLSFQYPSEIAGVTVSSFLRMIYNKKFNTNISPIKFRVFLKDKMEMLKMKDDFLGRYLNDGFSGGEKKRMEMLQMLILEPELVVLDEVDSGLDIDAVKIVSSAVNYLKEKYGMTVFIITHYTRILKFIKPDYVHVMQNGQIIKTGIGDLADEIEEKGYAHLY
jgi:Fe-S cluster assembly ATP-binding protein